MLQKNISIPKGLTLRPAGPSDEPFIESLYRSTRNDLQLAGDDEFVASLIQMQFNAQHQGYGNQFPNAMYFVVEKLGESIGRVTLDFAESDVRLVDIAFIPAARGKGYGEALLRVVQQTAGSLKSSMTLSVARSNPSAKQLYLRLGFQVVETGPMYELMEWYPAMDDMRA